MSILNASSSDPGDEVLKRFRYQLTYGAIVSVGLLTASDGSGLFCEHFEDFLLQLSAGRFVAIQVKTRDLSYGPLRATDDIALSSIARFVELEEQFADQIVEYQIVTNCGKYAGGTQGANCSKLRDLATSCVDIEDFLEDKNGAAFLKRFVEADPTRAFDLGQLVAVLARTTVHEALTGLSDPRSRLIDELAGVDEAQRLLPFQLKDLADALIMAVFTASSRQDEANELTRILRGNYGTGVSAEKLLTGEFVRTKIQTFSSNLPDVPNVSDLPNRFTVLERKLSIAGLEVRHIRLAREQALEFMVNSRRYSVDHGVAKLVQRDGDLKKIVHNLFVECVDKCGGVLERGGGLKILTELRRSLIELLASNDPRTNGLAYEDLLGLVAQLTEDCRLWWTTEQDLGLPA